MSAKQTLIGHILNAKRFYDQDGIWFGFGRPFNWDNAKLFSTVRATSFTVASPTLDLQIDADTVNILLPLGVQPISNLITAMNTQIQTQTGHANVVANSGYNHIVISSPIAGSTSYLEVLTGNTAVGFPTGMIAEGTDTVPDVDLFASTLEQLTFLNKTVDKQYVKPLPSEPAQVVGTVGVTTFNTIGDNTFTINIDGRGNLDITLTETANLPIDTAITEMNAYFATSPFYGGAYSNPVIKDGSNHIVITSPIKGSSSTIVVGGVGTLGGCVAVLGTPFDGGTNPEGAVIGSDGGEIKFRDTEWTAVPEADIFDEGARWVYLNTSLFYDTVPLIPFSQIGIYTGVVPAPGYETATFLFPDQLTELGYLEFMDNRKTVEREADKKETISIILEF